MDAEEYFSHGCACVLSDDGKGACANYLPAAELGHVEAKNMLAVVIALTDGNLSDALRWAQEAAAAGNEAAKSNVAQIKYLANPPGPGAKARLDLSWGNYQGAMLPVALVKDAAYPPRS